MPFKDAEAQREYLRQHYKNNLQLYKDRATESNRKRRERIMTVVREAKSSPCVDCGVKYPPYVMHFDHLDPETKTADVSQLTRSGRRIEIILAEIEKCELVCANCHAERTHQRRSGGRI